MRSLARYAVANTVARSRLSLLLKAEHFDILAQAVSMEDAWNFLLGTSYAEVLPSWSGQSVYEVDALLHNATGARFQGVVRALGGRAGEAGVRLLCRWDLDFLEYVLRLWHGKERDTFVFSGYRTFVHAISGEALMTGETIEDVVRLLEHTPYAATIAGLSSIYKQRDSLFYLENALEKDFYRRLVAALVRLGGLDGSDARALVDAEIDLVNLSCLVRLLNYSHIPAEDLHEYLIPSGSALSKRLVRPGKDGERISDLAVQVMTGIPGVGTDISTPLEGIAFLEKAVEEIAKASAHRVLAGYPFSFSAILAFYALIRGELRQLRSVFAAKSMVTDSAAILSVPIERR